jgi:hypothetical protein
MEMKIAYNRTRYVTIFCSYCLIIYLLFSCKDNDRQKTVLHYIAPQYGNISLGATADTLAFPLDSKTFRSIRSVNYFMENGKAYISFFDKQSLSVNLYDFNSQKLLKRISLQSCLPYLQLGKKTSVFYKNLDSLLVINKLTAYLIDSSLSVKDSVDLKNDPFLAFASFKSAKPPFIRDNKMYVPASPYLSTINKKEFRQWRFLYELDFEKGQSKLMYNLPNCYMDSIYGFFFFDISYCINNKNRVVFSFPADSNVYETDLKDYNVAYSGKSIFQKEAIQSATEDELKENMQRPFLLRNSYGDIYFDPVRKRYLRVAEQKITENEYLLGKRDKEKSVIYFDESLKRIGESKLDTAINLSTLLFTNDGKIYVRTKFKDENTLYFVRLDYMENSKENKLAAH